MNESLYFSEYRGAFPLYLTFRHDGTLLAASFLPPARFGGKPLSLPPHIEQAHHEAVQQLDAYYAGKIGHPAVPLEPMGTPFQRVIWERIRTIPKGLTKTYAQLAVEAGFGPQGARAVGNAVATNPLPVFIPCHRVLPATGGVGNYAKRSLCVQEGITIKLSLLSMEGVRLRTLERIGVGRF